ncbi:MAG: hypothetical protein Q8K86_01570 [Candidatus Nanopelagicaceae bacterium]|nr:hypothetical protein [Candidatus Nanopelagicaceae bacterium]
MGMKLSWPAKTKSRIERLRETPALVGGYLVNVVDALKNHELIEKVTLKKGRELRVAWRDGIIERYPTGQPMIKRKRNNLTFVGTLTRGDIPEILDADALGRPGTGYPFVVRKALKSCGILEQRIVVHQLLKRFKEEGWQDIHHAEQYVQRDLERLRNENLDKYWYAKGNIHHYISGHIFVARDWRKTDYSCGRTVWEQMPSFPDVVEMKMLPSCSPAVLAKWLGKLIVCHPLTFRQLWQKTNIMAWVLNTAIERRMDVTVRNVLWIASSRIAFWNHWVVGPRWTEPGFFRRIMSDLDLVGIYDLHPSCGLKALAATVDGRRFSYRPDGIFEKSAAKFSELTSVPVSTERNPDDTVWADFNFTIRPFEELQAIVDEFADDRLILFIPIRYKQKMYEYRRPLWGFDVFLRPECIPVSMFVYGKIKRRSQINAV